MPILTDRSDPTDWVEPDDVDRPVIAYGILPGDFGDVELDFHFHARGQVILVQGGALTCEVEGGLWIVPPRSAVWIPGGTLHAIKATSSLEGYCAFVSAEIGSSLPSACCAISVSGLLREILFRVVSLPVYYEQGGANSRLMEVLIDELSLAKVEALHLPMSKDKRLRGILDAMIASPADRSAAEIWAARAGMSERTLLRLIARETGMSLGRWRQQLCVMLAVKSLAEGSYIQKVAIDLGYDSVPSFVTMFGRVLGAPPGRYMAERYHKNRN